MTKHFVNIATMPSKTRKVTLSDIKSGDIFQCSDGPSWGPIFMMLYPDKECTGQVINLSTGYFSWFAKGGHGGEVYRILKSAEYSEPITEISL